MRKVALGLVFAVVGMASVGTAIGLYLAGQDGRAENHRQVVDAQDTPTSTATAQPAILPTSELVPTVQPPVTSSPAPAASGTPQLGVCPTPVRQTPEDFAEPPLPIEPPGQRVEGGTSFAEGYVTVHLPAGRQFIIQTGWSTDADGLYIAIYDIQAQSPMIIRGDGCETWRLVRDPAADVVFDEIMATLEIGPAYACPVPARTTYDEPPVQRVSPLPEGLQPPGRRVQGGAPFQLGPITLHLPAGREFVLGGGIADPGGEFFTVADAQTHSGLFLRPDGCEISRVSYPADDAVLDQIVATLEVER
jgi:hypothetical protein